MFVVKIVIFIIILGFMVGLKINLEMFKLRKMFNKRYKGFVGYLYGIIVENC